MYRGNEDPCISWQSLKVMQRTEGKVCPRVELVRENEVPAELALSAVKLGADNPLWGRLFEIHTMDMGREEKLELLYRVMAGAGHPDVTARMQRLRQQQKGK